MIDLSIIIVNWNAKLYLLRCIHSIVETIRTFRYEIIVVDNGSLDGSADAARVLFPSTIIIENRENLGFAKATNIGIRASTGRYIDLINSDVVVQDNCFHTLFDYMESHPHVGMTGPKMLSPSLEVHRSTMSFPSLGNNLSRAVALDSFFPRSRLFGRYLMSYREFKNIREVDVLNGFFWMIRRQALEEVGFLDESFFFYGEDIDLCRRFERAGWSRIYHPGAAAIHVGGASSAQQPLRFFIEMQKANIQYWEKYYGVIGSLAYAGILLAHHALRLLGFALKLIISPRSKAEARHKMRRSQEALRFLFEFISPRQDRE